MRYSIEGQILTDIADAINTKTGGTTALAPGDMADEIGSISDGGGGATAYTISGTGAAHVSVTDDVGLLYDEDRTNHVVLLMSAVFITLGTQGASAMYFSQDGHANQITFKGTSGLGDTTAVFEYTASGSSITEIWPVLLTIGSTDYTPYLAQVAWYITVMDNRGA